MKKNENRQLRQEEIDVIIEEVLEEIKKEKVK